MRRMMRGRTRRGKVSKLCALHWRCATSQSEITLRWRDDSRAVSQFRILMAEPAEPPHNEASAPARTSPKEQFQEFWACVAGRDDKGFWGCKDEGKGTPVENFCLGDWLLPECSFLHALKLHVVWV